MQHEECARVSLCVLASSCGAARHEVTIRLTRQTEFPVEREGHWKRSGIRRKTQCVWKTSRLVPPSHQPLRDEKDSEKPFLSEMTHNTHTHTHTRTFHKKETPTPLQDSPVAL